MSTRRVIQVFAEPKFGSMFGLSLGVVEVLLSFMVILLKYIWL